MFVWMLFLLLNAAIGFSAPAPSSAQASVPKGRSAEEAPTTITSKTMTVSNHENKAIFEGEVVLTRGPLTVHSDHMVVSFHPSSNGVDPKPAVAPKNAATGGKATKKEQAGGSEAMPAVSDRTISMIEATGRVEIQKEDGRATCQKAIYYEVERKIVLTGQPSSMACFTSPRRARKAARLRTLPTGFFRAIRSAMRADKLFAIDPPALLLPLFRHSFVLTAAGLPVLHRCLIVARSFLPSQHKGYNE